jgi:hypothetical protein
VLALNEAAFERAVSSIAACPRAARFAGDLSTSSRSRGSSGKGARENGDPVLPDDHGRSDLRSVRSLRPIHFAAVLGWLLGIGIIHTGIAWVIIYSAYPQLSTPVIGMLSFIYPIVAVVIDWAIYDHPLGLSRDGGSGC